MIHKTAIIDKSAEIDSSVDIGPYVIIGKEVKIKRGVFIGAYSFIEFATINENCKIYQNVCIGTPPQDLKYKNEKTYVIIGNDCIIREFATIHRASLTEYTTIGKKCYLMAYSHVAHDCILGEGVIMANCASLGGHVQIDDRAVIGGLAAIHQFCKVGKLAMLGGGTMVTMDVPPFVVACGDRVKLYGLNYVGLKRNEFSKETIDNLKYAYKTLFMSKLSLTVALERLENYNIEKKDKEIEYLINFIKSSKRGICRP